MTTLVCINYTPLSPLLIVIFHALCNIVSKLHCKIFRAEAILLQNSILHAYGTIYKCHIRIFPIFLFQEKEELYCKIWDKNKWVFGSWACVRSYDHTTACAKYSPSYRAWTSGDGEVRNFVLSLCCGAIHLHGMCVLVALWIHPPLPCSVSQAPCMLRCSEDPKAGLCNAQEIPIPEHNHWFRRPHATELHWSDSTVHNPPH